jgi:hypothetical protein
MPIHFRVYEFKNFMEKFNLGDKAFFAKRLCKWSKKLPDFLETCMPALWHLAFSNRSNSQKLDVSGISQLPRRLFQAMPVVMDAVSATSNSPLSLNITVAFPLTQQGRPRKERIPELNTQAGLSPVNASMDGLPHTRHHSRQSRLRILTLYETYIRYNPPTRAGAPCHYGPSFYANFCGLGVLAIRCLGKLK